MGSHRVGHDWSDLACMHALEKEMATQSSVLAWRIPGTEEPGGLPSMGPHRVGHDWSDLTAAAAWLIFGKSPKFSEFLLLLFENNQSIKLHQGFGRTKLISIGKPPGGSFLVAQMVKNLPAMQKTLIQSLDLQDPLEEGTATHSSFLSWRIPWAEESDGLQSKGSQRVNHNRSAKHTCKSPLKKVS